MTDGAHSSQQLSAEDVIEGVQRIVRDRKAIKAEYEDSYNLEPLQEKILWLNPGEKVLTVDRDFDLLIEYLKEKQKGSSDMHDIKKLQQKVSNIEAEKEEYIKLYNSATDELSETREKLIRQEKEFNKLIHKQRGFQEREVIIEKSLKDSTMISKRHEIVIDELKEAVQSLEKENTELVKTNKRLLERFEVIEKLRNTNKVLEQKLSGKEQENKMLLEDLEDAQAENMKIFMQNKDKEVVRNDIILDESVTFTEEVTMAEETPLRVEVKEEEPIETDTNTNTTSGLEILEERRKIKFLDEIDSQDLALSEDSDVNSEEEPPKKQFISISKELFGDFIRSQSLKLQDNSELSELETLKAFYYSPNYYSLLQAPKEIEKSQSWPKILQDAFEKIPSEVRSNKTKAIAEALYVLSSHSLRRNYDFLLKSLRVFETGFFTRCFLSRELKSRKNRSGKKLLSLSNRRMFFIMNIPKRRIYILKKRCEDFPENISKHEHSFLLKNVTFVENAYESILSPEQVIIKNKGITDTFLKTLLVVSFTFKSEEKTLYIATGRTSTCKEFQVALKALSKK